MRAFLVLLLAALPAQAQDSGQINVLERREIALARSAAAPTHAYRLTLAYLDGSGWAPEAIVAAVGETAQILEQCGVRLARAELLRIGAPLRYRDFFTPLSRQLAHALALEKPTIYFVTGTRQRPAFEAEAIGHSNSRTRPELAGSVWITRGTRDLAIAVAHELAHVLMDSGEHAEDAGNLMREDTAPENTRLSPAQCARLRDSGSANGLLRPP